jgi:hypothetical protein
MLTVQPLSARTHEQSPTCTPYPPPPTFVDDKQLTRLAPVGDIENKEVIKRASSEMG